MKFNKAADSAVKEYTELIIAAAKVYKFDIDIDAEFSEITDKTGKNYASSSTIISEIGVVVVFPDFKKKTATAAPYNVGLARAMEMEGYTEEYIESEGRVFGELLPIAQTNAEVLAYFLTHKINPIKPDSTSRKTTA